MLFYRMGYKNKYGQWSNEVFIGADSTGEALDKAKHIMLKPHNKMLEQEKEMLKEIVEGIKPELLESFQAKRFAAIHDIESKIKTVKGCMTIATLSNLEFHGEEFKIEEIDYF